MSPGWARALAVSRVYRPSPLWAVCPVGCSAILPAVNKIQAMLQSLEPSPEKAFSPDNFRDVFYPISIAAFVLLIVAVILYNVQVRKLHKHPPLVALQEWLLWTAVCVFGLLLVEAIFKFWFLTVVATIVIGLGTFIWIRFVHFPPIIEGYNRQLARARSIAATRAGSKYVDPSSTVRSRKSRKSRRR